MASPRWIYLHGLGSGPRSTKAAALSHSLAPDGVELEIPDLRVPTFRAMRYSAMVELTQRSLDRDRHRPVVLFGTSLGALVALQVAQLHESVVALVLFSPALDLPDHRRTRPWLSRAWRTLGCLPVPDKSGGGWDRVDAGFLGDLEAHGRVPASPRVPTLLLHGRADRMVDVRVSRAWARGAPQVQLVELEDGHDLLVSLPTVLHETRRFLGAWLPRGSEAAEARRG